MECIFTPLFLDSFLDRALIASTANPPPTSQAYHSDMEAAPRTGDIQSKPVASRSQIQRNSKVMTIVPPMSDNTNILVKGK
ncbi:hypothetical protein HO173_004114 [Letharia columbiana]|uniref:Uncharacterized protein n=1 Tax=Letharia columbiana TaxID=112416 RepID=A0A8H6FZZ4_9LECA|nr:uncharacterized protein HO173_004114 [Letharia columbiana]KAF6237913.1 hypothetical protein HO173_004114 [Letharia columbiana]